MGDRTTAIIVVMLLLSTLPTIAGEAGAPVSPLEAWLVIDASALDSCSAELTALAEATVRALRPGDRLRIVSAQPDEPRLHALESLAEDGGGWAIRPILADIHRSSFHRADLRAALGLPLAAARTGQAGHPRVVIVATDGRLNDERSAMLLLRVAELEANGAVVRCTGTEKTNKTLLVAAAQGQLNWTALDK